ncbi:MAG: tetratricopeptide repeat protein [Xanthobacteraceae bacterium]
MGLTVYCWQTPRYGLSCAGRGALAAIEMMRPNQSRSARFLASVAIVMAIGAPTAGCQTTQVADNTNSISLASDQRSEVDLRRDVEIYGEKYHANPSDVNVALHYAQALRGTGQYAQAAAVLEQISMQNHHNRAVLGEYGRALAENGDYQQALAVLDCAHTPDQADWHILSAQGAVLDQMGKHKDAQRYYLTALKIVPDEPTVLSNLGLSYALSKDLKNAEATLRRAAKSRAGGRLAGPLRRGREHRTSRSAARRSHGQCRLSVANAGRQRRRTDRPARGAFRRRLELISFQHCKRKRRQSGASAGARPAIAAPSP